MNVDIEMRYDFESVLAEMGYAESGRSEDILGLKVTDKFFVGGGCEYVMIETPTFRNISICSERAGAAN